MQFRFFKALPPLKYQKRLHRATALIPIFRRVNLFLAGCSSAEPASASVQSQNSSERTIFTTCQKRQPLSLPSWPLLDPSVWFGSTHGRAGTRSCAEERQTETILKDKQGVTC